MSVGFFGGWMGGGGMCVHLCEQGATFIVFSLKSFFLQDFHLVWSQRSKITSSVFYLPNVFFTHQVPLLCLRQVRHMVCKVCPLEPITPLWIILSIYFKLGSPCLLKWDYVSCWPFLQCPCYLLKQSLKKPSVLAHSVTVLFSSMSAST